jgi:hypothetical protein
MHTSSCDSGKKLSSNERRADPRREIDVLMNRFLNGYPYLCRASDISRTGMRLHPSVAQALRLVSSGCSFNCPAVLMSSRPRARSWQATRRMGPSVCASRACQPYQRIALVDSWLRAARTSPPFPLISPMPPPCGGNFYWGNPSWQEPQAADVHAFAGRKNPGSSVASRARNNPH